MKNLLHYSNINMLCLGASNCFQAYAVACLKQEADLWFHTPFQLV